MWAIDYVQVPDDQIKATKSNSENKNSNSPKHSKPDNESFSPTVSSQRHLIKQPNVFNDEVRMSSLKSGSESSLNEDSSKFSSKQRSDDCSSKEWISEQQDEKETCSDTEECAPPVAPARRRKSKVQMGLRKSEGWRLAINLLYGGHGYYFAGGNSGDSSSLEIDDSSILRTSKSDTSITDSFVMIPDAKKKTPNPMNQLRPGTCPIWFNQRF